MSFIVRLDEQPHYSLPLVGGNYVQGTKNTFTEADLEMRALAMLIFGVTKGLRSSKVLYKRRIISKASCRTTSRARWLLWLIARPEELRWN